MYGTGDNVLQMTWMSLIERGTITVDQGMSVKGRMLSSCVTVTGSSLSPTAHDTGKPCKC